MVFIFNFPKYVKLPSQFQISTSIENLDTLPYPTVHLNRLSIILTALVPNPTKEPRKTRGNGMSVWNRLATLAPQHRQNILQTGARKLDKKGESGYLKTA